MARRRRRRSLGELKHSRRKVIDTALRWARHGYGKGSRKVKVEVTIQHAIGASGGRGRYHSFACIGGASRRRQKCGGYAHGSTPTKALKAALRKLVASHRL